MRIGIDARLIGEPRSGIGRYTRCLVAALIGKAPDVRWTLFVDRPPPTVPTPPGAEVRYVPGTRRLVWTLRSLPRELRRCPVDLFHGVTGFELPLGGPRPLVTTVHDLIPFRLPALVPWRHRATVRCLLGLALRRAAAVIAVSATTRGEILARYRLPPDKVHVVPEAADAAFAPPSQADRAAMRERHGLDRPYVLFVGLVEPKKNLPALLQAVARLHMARAWGNRQLVVAGAHGWGPDPAPEAHRLGLEGVVRLLGSVPERDLPALYAEALAFVFPSLWEGFGLPVLEAMASGAPVVASSRGALPEVAGGAAVLADPSPGALAEALSSVLEDPALRERLRTAGFARAAEFSWERTAARTLAIYRQVA